MTRHLNEDTSLFYLVREFSRSYSQAPHGGSPQIRTHMKRVRDRVSRILKDNPVLRDVPQIEKIPVTAHFGRAIDNGQQDAHERFVRTIDKVQDRLVWLIGYDRLPDTLARRFGYADIVGPGGIVPCDDLALGLVLFAPGCVYPSHRHDGISESYISLSGACSQNDIGVFRPPSMIFNAPGSTHTIRTSADEPVLLAYAWTAEPTDLAAHKMRFTRRRKQS